MLAVVDEIYSGSCSLTCLPPEATIFWQLLVVELPSEATVNTRLMVSCTAQRDPVGADRLAHSKARVKRFRCTLDFAQLFRHHQLLFFSRSPESRKRIRHHTHSCTINTMAESRKKIRHDTHSCTINTMAPVRS